MARNPLFPILVLAGVVGAQAYRDSFNHPDGTTVPGWTERRGDWVIASNRLHVGTTASGFNFITKDGFNLRHSVTEALVQWEGPIAGIDGGGLCARHDGGSIEMGMILAMLQDNLAQGGFNALMLAEQGGSGLFFQFPLAPFNVARVRLVVTGVAAVMQVDRDLNGIWELTGSATLDTILGPGGNGCSAVFKNPSPRSVRMDDFALFDAALTTTGVARPGSTVTLRLQGNVPNLPYQAAAAFATAPGISVDTRNIPLAPDSLTVLSLTLPTVFSGFSGVTDANGAAQALIAFPPIPQLAGFSFYVAFVTLSPAAPSGIANISNDHRISIVP